MRGAQSLQKPWLGTGDSGQWEQEHSLCWLEFPFTGVAAGTLGLPKMTAM